MLIGHLGRIACSVFASCPTGSQRYLLWGGIILALLPIVLVLCYKKLVVDRGTVGYYPESFSPAWVRTVTGVGGDPVVGTDDQVRIIAPGPRQSVMIAAGRGRGGKPRASELI